MHILCISLDLVQAGLVIRASVGERARERPHELLLLQTLLATCSAAVTLLIAYLEETLLVRGILVVQVGELG